MSEQMLDDTLYRATARVEILQDGVRIDWGTGFLVGARHVLTAFHVVKSCVPGPGASRIRLVFRYLGNFDSEATLVDGAWDAEQDWALLECARPPRGVIPLALGTVELAGVAFKSFGFAKGANHQDGDVFSGEIENPRSEYGKVQALQLYSRQVAAGLGTNIQGLSGGPILAEGAVVGIVRSFLMNKDKGAVAGTIYACPAAPVIQSRVAGPLVRTDACTGLLPVPATLQLPAEPFRYLSFYTREDARLFFGRCREIEALSRMVTEPDRLPITLLYGQSGVGKSSLLQAGLFPRLEADWDVRYRRRSQEAGLLGGLAAELGCESLEPKAIEEAWCARESKQGEKPLLILLDQVEEVFTRPRASVGGAADAPKEELNALLRALHQHYAGSAQPLRSRVILAFRKSWLPELAAALKTWSLSAGSVFIPPMDKTAVREIVLGLTRDEKLRARYQLTVEPELVPLLVDDLTRDRESPVAPALQVLLTNLWREAVEKSRSSPAFTRQLYAPRRASLGLESFLEQQLAALPEQARQLGDKGLTLDLLAFHTTTSGAAERRSETERQSVYSDKVKDIEQLVSELKRVYLLVDPPEDSTADARATRLVHDTLGPIVRKRFTESGLPGQRARRVMENRAVDWKEKGSGPLLDAHDVKLVEGGLTGMRTLVPHERLCLEASQGRRTRNKWILRAAQAVFVVAALSIAGLWLAVRSRNTKLEAELHARALALARSLQRQAEEALVLRQDPVEALRYAAKAIEAAPEDDPRLPLYINQAVHLATRGPVEKKTVSQNSLQAGYFSRNGEWVVTVDDSRRVLATRLTMSGARFPTLTAAQVHELAIQDGFTVDVESLQISPDGRWLAGREVNTSQGSQGFFVIWELATGQRASTGKADIVFNGIWAPDSRSLWFSSESESALSLLAELDGNTWSQREQRLQSGIFHKPKLFQLPDGSIRALLMQEGSGLGNTCQFQRVEPFSQQSHTVATLDVSCGDIMDATIDPSTMQVVALISVENGPQETSLHFEWMDASGRKLRSSPWTAKYYLRPRTFLRLEGQQVTLHGLGLGPASGLSVVWKVGEQAPRQSGCDGEGRQTDEARRTCDLQMAERLASAWRFEGLTNRVLDAVALADRPLLLSLQRTGEVVVWWKEERRATEVESWKPLEGRPASRFAVFSADRQSLVNVDAQGISRWLIGAGRESVSTLPLARVASSTRLVKSPFLWGPDPDWLGILSDGESPSDPLPVDVYDLKSLELAYSVQVEKDFGLWGLALQEDGSLLLRDYDAVRRIRRGASWTPVSAAPYLADLLGAGFSVSARGKGAIELRSLTDPKASTRMTLGQDQSQEVLNALVRVLLSRAKHIDIRQEGVQLQLHATPNLMLSTEAGELSLRVVGSTIRIVPPRQAFSFERGTISQDGRFIAMWDGNDVGMQVWFHDAAMLMEYLRDAPVMDAYFFTRGRVTYLRTVNARAEVRDLFIFEDFQGKPAWVADDAMLTEGRPAGDEGGTLGKEARFESGGEGRTAFFQALQADSGEAAKVLLRHTGMVQ